MRKRSESVSRQEVTDTVDKRQSEFEEKTEDLGKDADDVETTWEAIREVDLEGTSEAAEAVEHALEDAERISEEQFEEDSEQLDRAQDESREHEQELQERSDGTEKDLGKIGELSSEIKRDRASREWIEAKEELVRDKEFLDEQEQRERDGREETERAKREYGDRVRAARGS